MSRSLRGLSQEGIRGNSLFKTRLRWRRWLPKSAWLDAFVAVPLAQRYTPFATRARELLAVGRFGPLSHIYVRINRSGPARYQTWDCAWMLDPAEAGGGCLRNLGPHGVRHVPSPDRRGGAGDWRPTEPARA